MAAVGTSPPGAASLHGSKQRAASRPAAPPQHSAASTAPASSGTTYSSEPLCMKISRNVQTRWYTFLPSMHCTRRWRSGQLRLLALIHQQAGRRRARSCGRNGLAACWIAGQRRCPPGARTRGRQGMRPPAARGPGPRRPRRPTGPQRAPPPAAPPRQRRRPGRPQPGGAAPGPP